MRRRVAEGFLGLLVAASMAGALTAKASPWLAASGQHGGGLGMKGDQVGRAWVDTALFSSNGEWAVSPILGAGVMVSPAVELEAALPIAAFTTGPDPVVGNPYIGASYVSQGPRVRLKVGAGVAVPVLDYEPFNDDLFYAWKAGMYPRAFQESWHWQPDAIQLVVPLHLEAPIGTPVSFTLDAAAFFLAPIDRRNDSELGFQIAPGVAASVSDRVALGTRFTVFVLPTEQGADGSLQTALEPFVRFAFHPVFASVRFTVPLDEPLGFAFDSGKTWGLHLGFGLAF